MYEQHISKVWSVSDNFVCNSTHDYVENLPKICKNSHVKYIRLSTTIVRHSSLWASWPRRTNHTLCREKCGHLIGRRSGQSDLLISIPLNSINILEGASLRAVARWPEAGGRPYWQGHVIVVYIRSALIFMFLSLYLVLARPKTGVIL